MDDVPEVHGGPKTSKRNILATGSEQQNRLEKLVWTTNTLPNRVTDVFVTHDRFYVLLFVQE